MSVQAKITVTTGPDRGKSCALASELARVGRDAQSDLVLTDPDLADHLASIVQREGRYAIITTVPGGVEINGTEVPVERWVWLPETAEIRVSRRTLLSFESTGSPEPAEEKAPSRDVTDAAGKETRAPGSASSSTTLPRTARPRRTPPAEVPGSGEETGKSRRTNGERKARTVARFITDGPGDPLVKLGEDGHLPELTLQEGEVREGQKAQARQTNPLIVLVLVGVSLGMTALMLLIDAGGYGDNTALKAAARREITEYYGREDETLKPYQTYLRQAHQARSRGDRDTERAEYRRVLGLLRSESKEKVQRYTGLTGRLDYAEGDDSMKSDRRLEELIAILLSD